MSCIYIAGPMTGIRDFNRPAFFSAAQLLTERGHAVLNPASLPDGLTESQYMDICLAMLRCADVIYLLDGWENSAGARVEYALADKLGLDIIFEGEFLVSANIDKAVDVIMAAASDASSECTCSSCLAGAILSECKVVG